MLTNSYTSINDNEFIDDYINNTFYSDEKNKTSNK